MRATKIPSWKDIPRSGKLQQLLSLNVAQIREWEISFFFESLKENPVQEQKINRLFNKFCLFEGKMKPRITESIFL